MVVFTAPRPGRSKPAGGPGRSGAALRIRSQPVESVAMPTTYLSEPRTAGSTVTSSSLAREPGIGCCGVEAPPLSMGKLLALTISLSRSRRRPRHSATGAAESLGRLGGRPRSDGTGSRPARGARAATQHHLGRARQVGPRVCAPPPLLDQQFPGPAAKLAEALPHSSQGRSAAGALRNAVEAAEPMPPGIDRPESRRARAAGRAPCRRRHRRRRDASQSGDPQSRPAASPRTPVAALGKAAESAEAVRGRRARTSRRGAAPARRLPACGDVAQW